MTLFSSKLASALLTSTLIAGLSAPVYAQEAEAPAEAATDEQPESVFNMGEEVDANGDPVAPTPQEPQPGQQYLSDVFTDWAVRCLKTVEGDDPCQIYQLLSDGEGNDVAEIAIVALPGGGQAAAGATIVVPLETLLPEQLTLRVDGGTARRFPYNFCNQGGCVARIGLTAEDVNLFRRGNTATLRMVPAAAPTEEVIVNMSLSGFTAAFESTQP